MRWSAIGWSTRGAVLLVAVAVSFAALWAAASNTAELARLGYRNVTTPLPLVRDSDIEPLAWYGSTQAFAMARRAIPSDATYAVVVGDDPPIKDHGTLKLIFRYWLMPRRYTTHLAKADWVIAYHHSSETLGVRYTEELGLAPDVNVVRVTR